MMFSVFRQKSVNFCLSLLVAGILVNSSSFATPLVGPGCDPAFMQAIQDKAWMEAQREIMIAQTTIAKPDSVFSLGCFDHWASGLSISFTNSNNYNYSNKISAYGNAAFPHTHGGGHYTGSNQNISNCSAMADLWNAARGSDLNQPSRLLGTLRNIATYDRGAFPVARVPTGFAGPLAKFYNPTAPTANTYKPKTANQSVGAGFNDMDLFSGVVAPFSQTAIPASSGPPPVAAKPAQCAKGIPTGISISGGGPEYVCPNPGCIWDTSQTKCCDYSGSNCSP